MAIQEQTIRSVIREVLRECHESPPEDEDNTKFRAIQPLLQTLDYRLSEIRLEDTNDGRKRPDYTLLPKDDMHRLRVEAKVWDADLDDHAYQTVMYAVGDGTNFAVLTNGIRWRLYDRRLPGKPVEQLASQVCLEDEDKAVRFLAAISKDSVLNGGLEKFAIEERKRREVERRNKVLSAALSCHLADEQSGLVGAMCDVLRKQAGLEGVSRADLVAFFREWKGQTKVPQIEHPPIPPEDEQPERNIIRKRFWTQLLEYAKTRTDLHSSISPTPQNWIGTGAGISGLSYNYAIAQHEVYALLYIDRGKQCENENLEVFKQLMESKAEIEQVFGGELVWDRREGRRNCQILRTISSGGYRDPEDKWRAIHHEMVVAMMGLEKAFAPHIEKLKV